MDFIVVHRPATADRVFEAAVNTDSLEGHKAVMHRVFTEADDRQTTANNAKRWTWGVTKDKKLDERLIAHRYVLVCATECIYLPDSRCLAHEDSVEIEPTPPLQISCSWCVGSVSSLQHPMV